MRPVDKIRNQDLPRGQGDHSTLYMSLELSRSTWLVTSLSPNSDKMSKHTIAAGDAPKLLALLARLRGRSEQLVGGSLNVTVIQEAGLDGFWVHRSLEANDIESHVVDPASIAVSRRRRRAKTDAIDGETLLRTFWPGSAGSRASVKWLCHLHRSKRTTGVSHVNAPTCCEREFSTSIASRGCSLAKESPVMIHKDRRTRLDELTTGDVRPLPSRLKAELLRELVRIELLLQQIADVEAERDVSIEADADGRPSPVALLARLKAIGPQIGAVRM
jgi:transposase